MKKKLSIILCLVLALSLLSGCGAGNPVNNADPGNSAVNAANAAEPASNTANTADQGNPANTANTDPAPARFVFQPKVCSSYQEGVFGKTMCEAWYKLVDAVMAGEDTFACPDDDTYNWVMGQFPGHSFPVLSDLIDYGEDRDHPVKDGVGPITYKVPKDVAANRIQEFAALVEGILNATMRTDYSDLEKALALYRFFSDTYTYDYDAADDNAFRDGSSRSAWASAARSRPPIPTCCSRPAWTLPPTAVTAATTAPRTSGASCASTAAISTSTQPTSSTTRTPCATS